MRFTITASASILLSLLALESSLAIPAPAPQAESEVAISSSATSGSPSASAGGCKAGGRYGHRRPKPYGRPSASETVSISASASASYSKEVSASSSVSSSGSETTEVSADIPAPSEPAAEPSAIESEVEMPTAAASTLPAEVTEIQNGNEGVSVGAGAGAGGGDQQPTQPPPSSPPVQAEPTSVQSSDPLPAQPSPPAQGGGGNGGAPEGFAAEILKAHNEYRASFNGAPPLVWNQTIADRGMEHYKDKNCVMEHSGLDGLGENLAATLGGGTLTAQGVVDMWGPDEAKYWSPGQEIVETVDENGNSVSTGHFSQVVWRETTDLGCVLMQCEIETLVFCEYYLPGNMMGNVTNFQAMVAP